MTRLWKGFYRFPPDQDDETRAAWLRSIVEEDRDRTALIAMPAVEGPDDDALDEQEEDFRRAYDLARKGRSWGVKFLHGVDENGPEEGASRVLVMLHEHKWVGGHCVNGCLDTRKAG